MADSYEGVPPDKVCQDGQTWCDDDGAWRDLQEPESLPDTIVIAELPGDPPPDLPPDLDAALEAWFRGVKWAIAQVLSVGRQS